ncbi:Anoctamin like protein [Aduncisulcus paluster]|uniref:Anoctamin like protein n=1 Tax=Aduncisulcus paluster TaxID=2918883 RepID=A0ABQ5KL13_9EUKA|nr:Anoctamin like protein [Aduncisulcus paluster]
MFKNWISSFFKKPNKPLSREDHVGFPHESDHSSTTSIRDHSHKPNTTRHVSQFQYRHHSLSRHSDEKILHSIHEAPFGSKDPSPHSFGFASPLTPPISSCAMVPTRITPQSVPKILSPSSRIYSRPLPMMHQSPDSYYGSLPHSDVSSAKPILSFSHTPSGYHNPMMSISPQPHQRGWFDNMAWGFTKGFAAFTGINLQSPDIKLSKYNLQQQESFASGTADFRAAEKQRKKTFIERITMSPKAIKLTPSDLQHITLDLQAADTEYQFRGRVSFCGSSLADLGEVYGHGNESLDTPPLTELIFWAPSTFPHVFKSWRVSSLLCIILWFVSGFIYGLVLGKYKAKVLDEDKQAKIEHIRDLVGDDIEIFDIDAFKFDEGDDQSDPYLAGQEGLSLSDERPENSGIEGIEKFIRYMSSWLIFLVCLALSVVILFYLHRIPRTNHVTLDKMMPFIVTLTIAILNAVYKLVGKILSDKLERRPSWSSTRKSALIKTFTFKMINLMALYAISGLVSSSDSNTVPTCPLTSTGQQFTTVILMDLCLFNPIEILVPLLLYFIFKKVGGSNKTDEELRTKWDQSDEYLELFYRLSQTYFGTLGSPFIALLALVTNLFEIGIDKVRLLYINRVPKRLMSSMKNFIIFYMFIIALCALLSYPNGSLIALVNLWNPKEVYQGFSFFERGDYQYCWE